VPALKAIFKAGRYDLCEQVCNMAEQRGQPAVDWRVIKFKALEAMGRIDEALEIAEKLPISYPDEIPALMKAHDLFLRYGKKEKAAEMLTLVNEAALKKKRNERTGPERVALGRAALALGADPRKVLDQYFAPVKKQKPKTKDDIPEGLIDAHIAAGNLALDKSDFKRAATEFQAALKFEPNDPDVRYGVAVAFGPSDQEKADESLSRALKVNPVHAPSLMRLAEAQINREQYDTADQIIGQLLSVNPIHPKAWAYKAIIANLARNDEENFNRNREKALEPWAENPEVDHTIGRVLSRNYRFAEGAASQRRALEFDPDFLPAKLQLANDLLRLGDEEEAWKLAEEVGEADPYEVLAYNFTILRDQIAKFKTIRTDDFIIRMPEKEAKIYGDRALEILEESKRVLCDKYGLELDEPVLVEFFPEQQDFAIRTFGNLGGGGILGACFGSVVTMNSPGGLAHGRNNWEATLWHEFCHVVTLTKTKNKMPRWLSEGISVYEEIERDPTWGQKMTPRYRTMILSEDALTPIGELSSAFIAPETGEHLMFAYYQSMLVVDYLIDNYGADNFRKILTDLADGVLINDAIARNTAPLEKLEPAFASYAKKLAEGLGGGVDWTQPASDQVNPMDTRAVAAFAKENPKNYWAWSTHTMQLLGEEKWDEAIAAADRLIKLYPENTENGGGYLLKARAYHALGDAKKEAETLRELASRNSEAFTANTKLLDLEFEAERWKELLETTDRVTALNPFLRQAHYCRGCAHESKQQAGEAITSFEKLLLLKPANPSEVRFRLARLLKPEDKERSKRYLLDSLAESPRFREAHQLLLAFQEKTEPKAEKEEASAVPPATTSGTPTPSPSAAQEKAANPSKPAE